MSDYAPFEAGGFTPAPDLDDLSNALKEIAAGLAVLAERQWQQDKSLVYQVSTSAPCINTILFVRRMRRQFLDLKITDVAWEVMLTILAVRLDGGRLTLNELSRSVELSPRATRRWVRRLEAEGFLESITRPEAGAKPLVDLTDQTASRMQSYIDAALQNSPWLL